MSTAIHDVRKGFVNAGSITASQSALAVTARTKSAVAALASTKKVVYKAGIFSSLIECRFSTDADGDAHVVNVYGSRGDDYVLIGTLTLTGGTQTGPNSNVYVDTIVESDVNWLRPTGTRVVAADGVNEMARWLLDLMGYSEVLFIATTLTTNTTLRIDIADIAIV